MDGTAFLFGTDANSIAPRDSLVFWKALPLKGFFGPTFRLADQVVVPSTASQQSATLPWHTGDHITLTPYSVDNDWWKEQSLAVRRGDVRQSWG